MGHTRETAHASGLAQSPFPVHRVSIIPTCKTSDHPHSSSRRTPVEPAMVMRSDHHAREHNHARNRMRGTIHPDLIHAGTPLGARSLSYYMHSRGLNRPPRSLSHTRGSRPSSNERERESERETREARHVRSCASSAFSRAITSRRDTCAAARAPRSAARSPRGVPCCRRSAWRFSPRRLRASWRRRPPRDNTRP